MKYPKPSKYRVMLVDTVDQRVHVYHGGSDVSRVRYDLDQDGNYVVNSLRIKIIPESKGYKVIDLPPY